MTLMCRLDLNHPPTAVGGIWRLFDSGLRAIKVIHNVVFLEIAPVDVRNLLQDRASVVTLIVR